MTNQSEYFFNDGFYRSLNVFYKTVVLNQTNQTTIPNFNLDITTTYVTKGVGFGYVFYSDEQLTQYAGETPTQPVLLRENYFQVEDPIPNHYYVGRLSLLPGSSLGISSFKINNVEQVQSGVMVLDTPPVNFVETVTNDSFLKSLKLYKISDPNFKIELEVQSIVGAVKFEYLKYSDENYTSQILGTSSHPVGLNQNVFEIDRPVTPSYILGRMSMPLGSSIAISSFKINGVEQYKNGSVTFTTPADPNPNPTPVKLQSTICFPAGTYVKTDQGQVEIQKLIPKVHTIQDKPIVAITETYSMDKVLVCIEKDALRKNYPNQDTLISKRHKIYYKGKLKAAQRLVGKHQGISFVPYSGEKLYNVLLEEYGRMNVQGLICETLHPMNPVAKIFCKSIL
jgi:hypothetical protein